MTERQPRPHKPHLVIVDDGTGTWAAQYERYRAYGSSPAKAEEQLVIRYVRANPHTMKVPWRPTP